MSTPPFHPRMIQQTVAFQFLAIAVISYLSLTGWKSAFNWAIPILLSIAAVGMKFAAPLVPTRQILAVVLIALLGNFLTDQLISNTGIPMLSHVGGLVIALICVYGFGRSWVKNGYLPKSAAAWT